MIEHRLTSFELSYPSDQFSDARTRVLEGIEWLDTNVPNWRDLINKFEIGLDDVYVLEQFVQDEVGYPYEYQTYMLEKYKLSVEDTVRLGFRIPYSRYLRELYGTYSKWTLCEAWIEQLS